MSTETLAVTTGDGHLAYKESGERLLLGVALGYMVSLVFLAIVLIGGYRYIDLYNSQASVSYAERRELAMPVVLLLLALPSALGGAVIGWIAYARPWRAAVCMFLLHGLIAPALLNDLDVPQITSGSALRTLWLYRDAIAFFWLLAAVMLLFAITSASFTGYLRRRGGP